MAQVPPVPSREDVEDEIQFTEILLDTLQPDALDYESQRESLNTQLDNLRDMLTGGSGTTEPVTSSHGVFSNPLTLNLSPQRDQDVSTQPGVEMAPTSTLPTSSRKRQRQGSTVQAHSTPDNKAKRTTPSPSATPGTPSSVDSLELAERNFQRQHGNVFSGQVSGGQPDFLARQKAALEAANQRTKQEEQDRAFVLSLQADQAAPTLPPVWPNTNYPATSTGFNPQVQYQTRNHQPESEHWSPYNIFGGESHPAASTTAGATSTENSMPGSWRESNPFAHETGTTASTFNPASSTYNQPFHLPHTSISAFGNPFDDGAANVQIQNSMSYTDPFADFDLQYSDPWIGLYGNQPGQAVPPSPYMQGGSWNHRSTTQMPGAFPGRQAPMNGFGSGSAVANGTYSDATTRNDPEAAWMNERRQAYSHMYHDSSKTKEEIHKLLQNIRPDEDIPKELRAGTPEAFVGPLLEHQKVGLAWLVKMEENSNKGGILADDMGFGKTIQAIALMVSRRSEDPRRKTTLIVAPVALMQQWHDEIKTKLKKGQHSLDVFIYHGSACKKTSHQDLSRFDVVLTTYGTLATEFTRKNKWNQVLQINPHAQQRPNEKFALIGDDCRWYRVILDEAQCIRNRRTNTANASYELQAQTRWCLTGTPMMNNVEELYSLIRFLRIGPYNDWTTFRRDFRTLTNESGDTTRAMTKLHALLKAILLRRDKSSTLDSEPVLRLPPKDTVTANVTFNEDEKNFYSALEGRAQIQFNRYLKAGTVGQNYRNALVLLLRLRQACCHPHLIRHFATQAATDLPPSEMENWARQLSGDVVNRIMSVNGAFECPVCLDGAENPAIFFPCGHDTCAECYAKLADVARSNSERDDGAADAKCPECRAPINPKKVLDYNTFKKVHLPEIADDNAGDEAKEQGAGSQSETESDEDSDDESSSLGGFIVDDDEEDKVTNAATDCEGGAVKKSKQKKTQKSRRTSKGKTKENTRSSTKTLAQLKMESLRNKAAKRKYLRRLRREWETSSKIDKTMELLRTIHEDDPTQKTIIFSQFTSLLDLLEIPMLDLGWRYERYDGSMKPAARDDSVRCFKTDPTCRIMLVSLKAGNAGLNLTAANQVIILDPFWNPYIELQAVDRTHRIGQERDVHVHRILVGETVEDRIIALQERKRKMIDTALDEKAATNVSRLGTAELAYLFGVGAAPPT